MAQQNLANESKIYGIRIVSKKYKLEYLINLQQWAISDIIASYVRLYKIEIHIFVHV